MICSMIFETRKLLSLLFVGRCMLYFITCFCVFICLMRRDSFSVADSLMVLSGLPFRHTAWMIQVMNSCSRQSYWAIDSLLQAVVNDQVSIIFGRSTTRKARDLWWSGIPSSVRGKVWKIAIGNDLNLTSGELISSLLFLLRKTAHNEKAFLVQSCMRSVWDVPRTGSNSCEKDAQDQTQTAYLPSTKPPPAERDRSTSFAWMSQGRFLSFASSKRYPLWRHSLKPPNILMHLPLISAGWTSQSTFARSPRVLCLLSTRCWLRK